MNRLLSILDGDAKNAVKSIGTSAMFYATALKCLKRDFGNPLLVAHFKMKNVLDHPQIKINDKIFKFNFKQ